MQRALRRQRQRTFVARYRARVRRWAARHPRWTQEDIERVTRLQAAMHGACCPLHRAWEHKHNRHRVAWEFPDEWDADAGQWLVRAAG
jgi:uncharacterized protein (UPF0248 family)